MTTTAQSNVSLEDELASIDLAVGWPAVDVPRTVATELAESSGNPDIVHWNTNAGDAAIPDTTGLTAPAASDYFSYDTGLFQDDSDHDTDKGSSEGTADPTWLTEMENPVANSEEALSIFEGNQGWAGGWGPWESDAVNNGQNSSAAQADLAAGQQGLSDVEQGGNDTAELTNVITWIANNLGTAKDPSGAAAFNNKILHGQLPAAAGQVATSLASETVTSGWGATALKLAAGGAGAVLIILGLYTAGSSAKSPEQKP